MQRLATCVPSRAPPMRARVQHSHSCLAPTGPHAQGEPSRYADLAPMCGQSRAVGRDQWGAVPRLHAMLVVRHSTAGEGCIALVHGLRPWPQHPACPAPQMLPVHGQVLIEWTLRQHPTLRACPSDFPCTSISTGPFADSQHSLPDPYLGFLLQTMPGAISPSPEPPSQTPAVKDLLAYLCTCTQAAGVQAGREPLQPGGKSLDKWQR